MNPATSAFLDILRIAAAFVVFINHCAQFWSPRAFAITGPLAHSAVVVFFVLSGYVIAYSTLEKERDPRRFILARLSRLYSVVLPALVLTATLQVIGSVFNPEYYAQLSRGFDVFRYILTGCFLQDIWHFSASPPTNAPFWSLSYEFWYYALFGVTVFVRARWARICALAAVSLIIGPNILLLMPCWLVGVGLFVFRQRISSILSKPRVPFAISVLAMLFSIGCLTPYPHDLGDRRFLCSGAFLTDWITALTVGASIASFDALRLPPPLEIRNSWVRRLANHTFSLYLYHFPLIVFVTATLPFNHSAVAQATIVAGCIVVSTLYLGSLTEARRDRWRSAFEWVFHRFASMKTSADVKCA